MAGLESIALAVAHLEQEESLKENGMDEHPGSWGCDASEVPIPTRQPICTSLSSFRRVSNDSCFLDEPTTQPSSLGDIMNVTTAYDEDMMNSTPPTLESLFESEKATPIPTPDTTEDIAEMNDNDVLCGRGGETNHWSGNVRYRSLVKYYQRLYLEARRRDKPLIARVIVRTIRLRGGRFLKKDANSKFWRDVGNQRAREKTSQALREGAPDLRSTQGDQPSQSTKNSKQRTREFVGEDEYPADTGVESLEDLESEGASPGKRQRVSLDDLADIVTCSSSPKPSRSPTLSSRESPQFPAIISGDDDDSGSDQSTPSTPRGPRLFILKQRLMQSGV